MEQFEVFDAQGNSLGLMPRQDVHCSGAWHKSAQVFVFDAEHRLLLQRRCAHKDLYAGLWDYSVGEHLQPGESYVQGAHRGLMEELGLTGQLIRPLGGLRHVSLQGDDYFDQEMQQAFICITSDPVTADAEEVAQIRWMALPQVQHWVESAPQQFTPWFIEQMQVHGFLEVSSARD